MIDNTAKTRAIFEINKGVNRNPAIDVNARMGEEQRRVPIRNMIYIADGPSDVPVFSIVNQRAARPSASTPPSRGQLPRGTGTPGTGSIQGMAEADFREGEAAYLWLMDSLDQIAEGDRRSGGRAFADIPPAGACLCPGHSPGFRRPSLRSGSVRGDSRATSPPEEEIECTLLVRKR